MAEQELWYADQGPLIFDDDYVGWYDSYPLLPTRAALLSQAYVTDAPVHDWEVVRKIDLTATANSDLMRIYMLMGA